MSSVGVRSAATRPSARAASSLVSGACQPSAMGIGLSPTQPASARANRMTGRARIAAASSSPAGNRTGMTDGRMIEFFLLTCFPRCSLASSRGPGHLRLVEALLEGGPVGVALPDAEDALAELLRFVLAIGDLSQVAQQGDREGVFAGLLPSDHLVDPVPGRVSLRRQDIETLG